MKIHIRISRLKTVRVTAVGGFVWGAEAFQRGVAFDERAIDSEVFIAAQAGRDRAPQHGIEEGGGETVLIEADCG